MSVLAKPALIERLKSLDKSQRLVITPLLHADQIGDASIDVRLGQEFLTAIRSDSAHQAYEGQPVRREQLYDKSRVPFKTPFFVHPNQLVLGATLEFVGLPPNLTAQVIGRSSLGRTGLVIATATSVAPGFRGCITLEIVNLGDIPLPLYPGMRVAQLVMFDTVKDATYKGRFACAVGPEPPKLTRDPEMSHWAELKDATSIKG